MTSSSAEDDLESRYAQVPADFPRPHSAASLRGEQAKLRIVMYEEKLYVSGCTPPEVVQRWEMCTRAVPTLVAKAKLEKAGIRRHKSETKILENYFARLRTFGLFTIEEAVWTIRRTALELGWKAPELK